VTAKHTPDREYLELNCDGDTLPGRLDLGNRGSRTWDSYAVGKTHRERTVDYQSSGGVPGVYAWVQDGGNQTTSND